MGELVRRLDYERRSKAKSLMCRSGQQINKEHSTAVRSANAMQERKKDLYILRNQMHEKMFLSRHDYEKKVVERFKEDLDIKSQDFNEEKFQMLRRAQSAGARLNTQKTKCEWETLIRSCSVMPGNKASGRLSRVQFSVESSSSEEDLKEISDKTLIKPLKKTKLTHMKGRKMPPQSVLRRRRISYAGPSLDNSHYLPAKNQRGVSSPTRMMQTAYVPREISSAPPGRSRSRASNGSSENLDASDSKVTSRSFRIIREAFRKKKVEPPDPHKDKFDTIKIRHKMESEKLHKELLLRFEDIIERGAFNVY